MMLCFISAKSVDPDKIMHNATFHLGLHCLPKYLLWISVILLFNLAILQSKQGPHRLEKYLNLESCLEKSLKIKYALKSTGKLHKGLEKSLNSSIFCRN